MESLGNEVRPHQFLGHCCSVLLRTRPGSWGRRQPPSLKEPGLKSQGSTQPQVESAGFPQLTMVDFRMTLAEAEVSQPSQPPLSIFSPGLEKGHEFTAAALHQMPLSPWHGGPKPVLIWSPSPCSVHGALRLSVRFCFVLFFKRPLLRQDLVLVAQACLELTV